VSLVKYVKLFGFIAGYQKHDFKVEEAVNIEAAYHMGVLHDALKDSGYTGRDLEIYLVRLLFCLFADDTGIFERGIFLEYLNQKTNTDGSDLGMHLAQLFQVLNTTTEKRQKTLDESLAQFPYINGHLFEQQLSFASFNSRMRATLLQCCILDWNKISPAIFGSMFQSVMNEIERRNLGAHYTSEKNILKVIKPLFLDALWQEFAAAKTSIGKLKAFHKKVASLRFLDPACGCGNFLVITYRELRLLELAILKELQRGQMVHDISQLVLCDVDRFYGIEYEEFPAQIAQVALWLTDHQMNMMVSAEFGEYFVRLPLKKSAKITHGNALRTDWGSLIEPLPWETASRFDYIFGNPPFVGHQLRNEQQMLDMELVFGDAKRAGRLDYVTAWYLKSAQLIQNTGRNQQRQETIVAFVSTNSISQGEQTGILWSLLFNQYNIKIHFAHRTFKWNNEAKGNAAVHCVIIGFACYDSDVKKIYEYEDINGEPHEIFVKNINSYLIEGKNIIIESRSTPIHQFSEMAKGSQPTDGGHLILNKDEKEELLLKNSLLKPYIKRYLGAFDLLNDNERYCLWFVGISPGELRNFTEIRERLENVRKMRISSPTPSVNKDADIPYLFTQIRQPHSDYIVIPETSSSNRKYIPISFLPCDVIASNSLQIINNSSLYLFGVLQSKQHDIWMRNLCGRLKNDFRYTPNIYHSFPFPENPTEKQKETIEKAAQKVLDVREQFVGSSLADLYNPLTMPPELVKAHNELDKAVDLAYRPQPFANETKRIEYLFELYDKYTAGLFPAKKGKSR
jgi:hypothetical protein